MNSRFSVSWSSYQKNICNGLSSLQQRGEMVDMTLAAGGHHVQVHKMILCLMSPYIKELVATTNCAHPVIFLNNVSKATLQYILEYVYTGEALVPRDQINEFLQACKSLHIKGLEHIDTDLHNKSETIITKPVEKRDPIDISGYEEKNEGSDLNDEDPFENINEEIDLSDETEQISKFHKMKLLKKSQDTPKKESILQYTISNRGKLQIILNRYVYGFHYLKKRSNTMVWRCPSSKTCPATVITKDGKVLKRLKAHNHKMNDRTILRRVQEGIVFSELKDAQKKMEMNINAWKKDAPSSADTNDD